MIYIAHRANYNGKNLQTENTIDQISYCLSIGFDVEIDVWYAQERWWLGHDYPQYQTDITILQNPKIWCHAKNAAALFRMMDHGGIHCFWHDRDAYTITSNGYIWAYPGSMLNHNSICVLPERASYTTQELNQCAGICSDNIQNFV